MPNLSGRKKDLIWMEFKELPRNPDEKCPKVSCKACNTKVQGLVSRMKNHIEKHCLERNNNLLDKTCQAVAMNSQPNRQCNLEKFIVKTTEDEKKRLDLQLARMIFSTNVPFRIVNNNEFIKLCSMMRCGYAVPDRSKIGGSLLESVYYEELNKAASEMKDQIVCLSIDGWENVSNDSIICASVTTDNGQVYLIDTINTFGDEHSSSNLQIIAENSIKKAKEKFGCKVKSFCTDNAANMVLTRNNVEIQSDGEILSFGCSAHALNLLAKDVMKENNFPKVKDHVIQVIKYFKHHKQPKAWYKEAGGKFLIMPLDVRWNSYCDSFECYNDNWAVLAKVCEERRNENNFDLSIANKVIDVNIKRCAEQLVSTLKPISIAIDQLQSNDCKLANAVLIWKKLKSNFENAPSNIKCLYQKRFDKIITDAHLAAFLLSPKMIENDVKLLPNEKERALNFIELNFPLKFTDILLKFIGKVHPFRAFLYEGIEGMTDFMWWKSVQKLYPELISHNNLEYIAQLHTAVASSAGLERLFSKFGLTQTKLRNRLGDEKAAMLVFVNQQLNANKFDF